MGRLKNRFDQAAEAFIEDRMEEPLLHGDLKHQTWLREELMKWVPDLSMELESWFEEGKDEVKSEVERLICR